MLRLFAAIAVMVFHLGFKSFSDPGSEVLALTGQEPGWPGGWPWTWWGWVGVQIFFVISGLVIGFSAMSARATAGRFLRKRILRLVPAVLIAACVALAVEITIFGTPVTQAGIAWIRTVLFFPTGPWIMGQFWTLGIEVFFYALVLIFIVVKRTALLPMVGLALILLCGLYWVVRSLGDGSDPLGFGRGTQLILLQHGIYFGIGILLSDTARRGWQWWHGVGIALGCAIAGVQIRQAADGEAGAAGLAGLWPIAFGFFLLAIGLVIVALHWNDRIVARLGASAGTVRMAGLMTYPLYLLHNHTGKPTMAWAIDLGAGPVLATGLAMAVTVLVSLWVAARLEPALRTRMDAAWDKLASKRSV
nr:acyltransferase [Jannaschia pohangensis]